MVLMIPHRVGPSAIHASGLFTEVDLAAGTPLWHFDPSIDSRCPLEQLSELEREHRLHFGYINPARPDWVVTCGDAARFWNFPPPTEAANCGVSQDCRNGEQVVVTLRGIKAGEELTIEPASDADYQRKMRQFISQHEW